jgi:hypothetical protein
MKFLPGDEVFVIEKEDRFFKHTQHPNLRPGMRGIIKYYNEAIITAHGIPHVFIVNGKNSYNSIDETCLIKISDLSKVEKSCGEPDE